MSFFEASLENYSVVMDSAVAGFCIKPILSQLDWYFE